jgi:hypothetical protein
MKARARIDAGICRFTTDVTAATDDGRHVVFEFESDCDIIRDYANLISQVSPIDAIATLGPDDSPMLTRARELLRTAGCCEACIVPAGAVKAMYVATDLALPRDVSLRLTPKEA